jgi:RNA polymerase sigma-70 factor (ECF subfamily)
MGNYKNLSDLDLVHHYQRDSDLSVIGELFARHRHIVLGIAINYLKDIAAAEDATMSIFEEMIKILQKSDIKNFKPWLTTVTRNYLHKLYRTESKQSVVAFEEEIIKNDSFFMELLDDDTHITEKIEIENRETAIYKAIDSLNKDQSVCIRLFFLEKKSYVEICEQTGFSFKEVKSFIQNGKRNLKIKLEGEQEL